MIHIKHYRNLTILAHIGHDLKICVVYDDADSSKVAHYGKQG